MAGKPVYALEPLSVGGRPAINAGDRVDELLSEADVATLIRLGQVSEKRSDVSAPESASDTDAS